MILNYFQESHRSLTASRFSQDTFHRDKAQISAFSARRLHFFSSGFFQGSTSAERIWHERVFFRGTNFLTKNAPKFSLKFLNLYLCGSKKNPTNIPPNFPPQFFLKHRRASGGAQGEDFFSFVTRLCV